MPGIAKSSVQVNDFTIDYLPNGQVSQFYSDLSVLDPKGKEITRKLISVNVPLRAGGVTMYQTDWALSSMQVTVEREGNTEGGAPTDQTYVLPMASLEGKGGFQGRIWGTFLPVDFDGDQRRGISLVARDFQSVAIYDSKGTFVGVRRPESKKPIVVDGLKLVLGDLKGSTGLELKTDPGVPLVYAGFAGLMVTSFLSLLSHSQVWAIQEETSIIIGGKTNRAKEEFRTELNEVLNSIPEYVD
jgi:cytochrome c biogenesis protein